MNIYAVEMHCMEKICVKKLFVKILILFSKEKKQQQQTGLERHTGE